MKSQHTDGMSLRMVVGSAGPAGRAIEVCLMMSGGLNGLRRSVLGGFDDGWWAQRSQEISVRWV